METDKMRIWRYDYLKKFKNIGKMGTKLSVQTKLGSTPIKTVINSWSDVSKEAVLDEPISKSKRIVVCHAFAASGLVENTLLVQ